MHIPKVCTNYYTLFPKIICTTHYWSALIKHRQFHTSENFRKLQDELTDIENTIGFARRFYNASVRDFNTKIGMFPMDIVAKVFRFKEQEYFQLDSNEEAKSVDVHL